jgi:SAM-dependent methyltransferase
MTSQPLLTDPVTRAHRLRRATDKGMFLHDLAIGEIHDRLGMVNRSFNDPVVVTPFADRWAGHLPDFLTVGDRETLPLDVAGHDLVIHAMGLHWANDMVGQLVQCRRALRPDGMLIAALLGGQTLHELRICLAEAESAVVGGLSPRVAPMADLRDLGGLLQRVGLALPVADNLSLKVEYDDIWHLMRDLRSMGEGNALAGRLRHPTRRAVFDRAAARRRDWPMPCGPTKGRWAIDARHKPFIWCRKINKGHIDVAVAPRPCKTRSPGAASAQGRDSAGQSGNAG